MRRGAHWKTVQRDAMTDIKQAIRDELAARGMTQQDFAYSLGYSNKHVSQILTGAIAGYETTMRMAAALGLIITCRRVLPESPLTWEGRYDALRKAYDENRAALESTEDSLARLTDWIIGVIQHHAATENRGADASLALAVLVKLRVLGVARER